MNDSRDKVLHTLITEFYPGDPDQQQDVYTQLLIDNEVLVDPTGNFRLPFQYLQWIWDTDGSLIVHVSNRMCEDIRIARIFGDGTLYELKALSLYSKVAGEYDEFKEFARALGFAK